MVVATSRFYKSPSICGTMPNVLPYALLAPTTSQFTELSQLSRMATPRTTNQYYSYSRIDDSGSEFASSAGSVKIEENEPELLSEVQAPGVRYFTLRLNHNPSPQQQLPSTVGPDPAVAQHPNQPSVCHNGGVAHIHAPVAPQMINPYTGQGNPATHAYPENIYRFSQRQTLHTRELHHYPDTVSNAATTSQLVSMENIFPDAYPDMSWFRAPNLSAQGHPQLGHPFEEGYHEWDYFDSTNVFIPYDVSGPTIYVDVKRRIDVQVQAIWEDPYAQGQVAGNVNIPFPNVVAGNSRNETFGTYIARN